MVRHFVEPNFSIDTTFDNKTVCQDKCLQYGIGNGRVVRVSIDVASRETRTPSNSVRGPLASDSGHEETSLGRESVSGFIRPSACGETSLASNVVLEHLFTRTVRDC